MFRTGLSLSKDGVTVGPVVPTLPRRLYSLAFHADARFDLALRRMRRALGVARPLRLLTYRGFGTRSRVCVKARVQEDRRIPPPAQRRSLLGSAVASYKRYATVEIPKARVRASWGDATWETTTDDEGFVELWIEPPANVSQGWHLVTLEVLEPDDGLPMPCAYAPVLVAGDQAELGVISDIDDTVIATGVTNILRRAHALFLTEHRKRLPFDGVSELYAALHSGSTGRARNPVFYVSSSPWNLYEYLDHFMSVNDLPPGPILLRDWGLTRTGFAPGGGHGHKLDRIREVLDTFPGLPFVLFGDSGQEDAEHYRTIVREEGERIRAVYIRIAHRRPGREAELRRIAEDVRALGSEMIIVRDSAAAARHAALRGFIEWKGVERVDARRSEDEHAGERLDEVPGDE